MLLLLLLLLRLQYLNAFLTASTEACCAEAELC
jgi:hypothetical protein